MAEHAARSTHPPALGVELHCHSTASDGSFPPAQVVALAAARGVRVLAHGMALIPGVELSCAAAAGEIHLLGYFVAVGDAAFEETLARFRDGRDRRGAAMVEKLNAIGVPVRWERVKEIAGDAAITRPHVARAMIEIGAVISIDDAFARYLGRGRPAYVARMQLAPADAVRLVRSAGGVPVLAHPRSVSDLDAALAEMIPAGLIGMEAYYSAYTPEECAALARIAASYHLITTVGSDFHGDVHGGAVIGGTSGPPDTLTRLVQAAAGVRPHPSPG
jgi:predicted metal-dependent phosphoesterase TrpH